MRPRLPGLLILLLGAAFYMHRREVINSVAASHSGHPSPAQPAPLAMAAEPLPRRTSKVIEPTPQLVHRFESILKNRQPELQHELRQREAELEVSRWQGLLEWPADKAAAARRLATPKLIALAEARQCAGLSVQEFRAGIAAARAELEKAMLQALGAEAASAWKRAYDRSRERGAEDKVNTSMRAIEDVLSLEAGQKDRLHDVLRRQALAEPEGPRDDLFILKVTHDPGVLPPLSDELILAKDILTPDQMIQFDLAQKAREKMSEVVLNSFRRLLARFATTSKP